MSVRKNLIHDILKNQFQTSIEKKSFRSNNLNTSPPEKYIPKNPVNENIDSSIPEITPRPRPQIPRPEYYGNIIDEYPYNNDSDSINSCRGDRDCLAGEICLDGHCEPSSEIVPDEDPGTITEIPQEIIDWRYLFSHHRSCVEFMNENNNKSLVLKYRTPDMAVGTHVRENTIDVLSDRQIEDFCNKTRSIFLLPPTPVPRPNPNIRRFINE
jgi:hypothetical protein